MCYDQIFHYINLPERCVRSVSRSQQIIVHGPNLAHYLLFVSKVSSEYGQVYLFTCCATMIDLYSYNEDHMSCNAESIYNRRLQKKFSDPWIRVSQEWFQKLIRKVLAIILMRHYKSLTFNRVSQMFSIIGPQFSPFPSALNQNPEAFC